MEIKYFVATRSRRPGEIGLESLRDGREMGASTNNAVRLDGAASALIFYMLRRRRDLAASVPKTYSTTIRLAIFGYRLEQQAFGGGASWKMVSLIASFSLRPAQTPTSGSFLQ